MNIVVLGSGGWGTALAMLLEQNRHTVTLWSHDHKKAEQLKLKRENPLLPGVQLPVKLQITNDLNCLRNAELVVFASPSFALRAVAKEAAPYLPDGAPLLSVTKGIERGTHLRMSQVIAQETGGEHPIAVLSGPSHAEEVARAMPTGVVAASNRAETAELVQRVFTNERFRVYTHDDMVGVELAGALKNVAALCCGVSDGLGLGDNTKALLITRAMAETSRLAERLGGRKETLAGLAGMGDLIVTCTSMHSRNLHVDALTQPPRRHRHRRGPDAAGGRRRYGRRGRGLLCRRQRQGAGGLAGRGNADLRGDVRHSLQRRGGPGDGPPADEPRAEARNRQRMGINRKAVRTDRLFQPGEKTMCLLEQLERYEPYNEQEARDRALLLRALREEADVFTRENDRMHMTASAWVTNEAHDGVLMAYHNIYDSWAWLGGHADGEEDLPAFVLH